MKFIRAGVKHGDPQGFAGLRPEPRPGGAAKGFSQRVPDEERERGELREMGAFAEAEDQKIARVR
jgi:hypothetical protein